MHQDIAIAGIRINRKDAAGTNGRPNFNIDLSKENPYAVPFCSASI
jgi:hypothetical protein